MKRTLYLVGGLFSLGLGILGAFLPLLPTTCFILLAAWCFSKSSDRFHQKLISHPKFGPLILDWRAHHIIRKKPKIYASIMILFSFSLSIYFVSHLTYLVFGLVTLGAGLIGFILSRPSEKKVINEAASNLFTQKAS